MGALIVIFGGTGNLAYKKLYISLYNLYKRNELKEDFKIISVGRRDFSNNDFRDLLLGRLIRTNRFSAEENYNDFLENILYHKLEFNNKEDYESLNRLISLDGQKKYDNRVYYLATAPEYFKPICENLDSSKLLSKDITSKVVIEKPFGKNLEDARSINQVLESYFEKENIYRTDHYLGKEMIQNILIMRFSNSIFEPMWNSKYISNVQINVSEAIGIDERGNYYESAGALRDMVQSHMLQILSLVAMEPPLNKSTESIRDKKVELLKDLKCFDEKDIENSLVLGQYISNGRDKGYRDEIGVDPMSRTETFVALKISIDNERWRGTNFYIKTGKRLKKKLTEVVIEFKNDREFILYKDLPNILKIKIQPEEGMLLSFNLKDPAKDEGIMNRQMEFCQNCLINYKSVEAYEKLIVDVIEGDQSLFARWDELESSWMFVDKINSFIKDRHDLLKFYSVLSDGPKESNEMIKRDGFNWWG